MTFSGRVPADLAPNRLTMVRARVNREQWPILDLTESNPTRAGVAYPPDLLAPLGQPRGLVYAPEPFGLMEARQAVARDFARRGIEIAADRLALTTSTSEAYSLLFKLLCAPGDEVLIPRPSYPLFEHLTRLDAVSAVPYDLEYHGRWSVDVDALARRFSEKTRAVLIVSPNNPTGHFVSTGELDAIAAVCRRHGTAIIADQVFDDYELTAGAAAASGRLTNRPDVLGFTLGGLSKSVGLPQVKLGWIAMSGQDERVRDAREALELICDTYLSVSTPVQAAAAELLEQGAVVRSAIQQRIAINHHTFIARAMRTPACEALPSGGGWNGVLRVPSTMAEEDLVLSLLTEDHVLVHPGYFFDFPAESYLIVSLLAPEAVFTEGLERVLRRFGGTDAVA